MSLCVSLFVSLCVSLFAFLFLSFLVSFYVSFVFHPPYPLSISPHSDPSFLPSSLSLFHLFPCFSLSPPHPVWLRSGQTTGSSGPLSRGRALRAAGRCRPSSRKFDAWRVSHILIHKVVLDVIKHNVFLAASQWGEARQVPANLNATSKGSLHPRHRRPIGLRPHYRRLDLPWAPYHPPEAPGFVGRRVMMMMLFIVLFQKQTPYTFENGTYFIGGVLPRHWHT